MCSIAGNCFASGISLSPVFLCEQSLSYLILTLAILIIPISLDTNKGRTTSNCVLVGVCTQVNTCAGVTSSDMLHKDHALHFSLPPNLNGEACGHMKSK